MLKLSSVLPFAYGLSSSLNLMQEIFVLQPSTKEVLVMVLINLVGAFLFYKFGKLLDTLLGK